MKRSKTLKRIWSMFLTLAMVLTMGIAVMPSYAAGSGTATVMYPPAAEGKVTTTFTLYKVGHFERDEEGNSYLALDEGMPDSIDVRIKKADYTDEDGNVDVEAWTAEWQKQAASLATTIETTDAEKYTATASQETGGVATFTGLEDGLYLVTGPKQPQKYMDTDKEENTYFTPSPSFIMVLNHTGSLSMGDTVIKKYTEDCIKEYVIKKVWVDEGHEALRPDSVKVILTKTDTLAPDPSATEEEQEVILSKDKGWTYTWSDDPRYAYTWREELDDATAIHYIVSTAERMGTKVDDEGEPVNDDNIKYVTFTNTYTKRQLELEKILDNFVENGENSATFVFEIRGFIGDRQVYTGSAGINFAKDSTGSIKKLVENIPVNLTRLEVEEIYASNYTAVGGEAGKKKDAEFHPEEGLYTVSFENKFEDDITIKGGIVNTYTNEEGEIVLTEKDYGKVPTGGQE